MDFAINFFMNLHRYAMFIKIIASFREMRSDFGRVPDAAGYKAPPGSVASGRRQEDVLRLAGYWT
mgnify:CR=1 FL=1